MSNVTLNSLVKRFGTTAALKSVDLEVREREFLAVVGPSGCGKSSLLRLISGLERPTSGQIAFDGKDVTVLPPERRDVAMVFQSYALYPHMSVRRNLSFPLENMGLRSEEIERRLERVSRMLDIVMLLERRPRELSGGQRQRVALGRAIIRDASVFLFDEPLSNLDAKLRVTMRSELKQLHNELRKTFIYVTHDQAEAMTMADRIVVMSEGRIQQIGTPEEIYSAPRNMFVAEFIGTPSMNMIGGVIEVANGVAQFRPENGGAVVRLSGDWQGPLPANATLGIRPEAIAVGPSGNGGAEGVIELVEPLHPDVFLTVRYGRDRLIVRADASRAFGLGERVGVTFQSGALHLFGADGARLSGP